MRLFKKENSHNSNEEIIVDLHNPKCEIFHKIKEFSVFSLEDMHKLYKFDNIKVKFYSSLYESKMNI